MIYEVKAWPQGVGTVTAPVATLTTTSTTLADSVRALFNREGFFTTLREVRP